MRANESRRARSREPKASIVTPSRVRCERARRCRRRVPADRSRDGSRRPGRSRGSRCGLRCSFEACGPRSTGQHVGNADPRSASASSAFQRGHAGPANALADGDDRRGAEWCRCRHAGAGEVARRAVSNPSRRTPWPSPRSPWHRAQCSTNRAPAALARRVRAQPLHRHREVAVVRRGGCDPARYSPSSATPHHDRPASADAHVRPRAIDRIAESAAPRAPSPRPAAATPLGRRRAPQAEVDRLRHQAEQHERARVAPAASARRRSRSATPIWCSDRRAAPRAPRPRLRAAPGAGRRGAAIASTRITRSAASISGSSDEPERAAVERRRRRRDERSAAAARHRGRPEAVVAAEHVAEAEHQQGDRLASSRFASSAVAPSLRRVDEDDSPSGSRSSRGTNL